MLWMFFSKREEIQHVSHLADFDEVKENDYNLSVSTYVEAKDTREAIRMIIEEIEVDV